MAGNKEGNGITDAGSKSDLSSYSPTQLRELYQKNAVLFAELADAAIRKACIGKTPAQTLKLQRLQWTIDSRLRKGKTALERMQIMEDIFYGEVYGSNGLLVKLMLNCERLRRHCG